MKKKVFEAIKKAFEWCMDHIDTAEFTFFFPLAVFGLGALVTRDNPFVWAAFILWTINVIRNYRYEA